MNVAHASTAEVVYEAPAGEDASAVERLTAPRDREPLVGTQIRFARDTLSGAQSQASQEPLFGNRLRWAARTIRDAMERRRH